MAPVVRDAAEPLRGRERERASIRIWGLLRSKLCSSTIPGTRTLVIMQPGVACIKDSPQED